MYKNVVVVDAVRSPFVRAFGQFTHENPLSLSLPVLHTLVNRNRFPLEDLGELIWSTVVPQTKHPNLARDLVLFGGLPRELPAFTLSKACISSLQTVVCAADSIEMGRSVVSLAGGADVMSAVPVVYSDRAQNFLTQFSRSPSMANRLVLLSRFRPGDFIPQVPAITEPFTQLTMGAHAEHMAVQNNITRQRQDAYCLESHKKAHNAIQSGFLSQEIVPVFTPVGFVTEDNIVRWPSTMEDLARLKPVFDTRHGTITAATSTPLTDGASGVLLAHKDYAQSKNLPILGHVVDWVCVAMDPEDQLLLGPSLAIPRLLKNNGLSPEDVGVYEVHEAFAAQILSCFDKLSDSVFCEKYLKMPACPLPDHAVNIDGGSLAYGHPFAATGTRLMGRALRILSRQQGSPYGVVAACAAGAMAQAVLVKVDRT